MADETPKSETQQDPPKQQDTPPPPKADEKKEDPPSDEGKRKGWSIEDYERELAKARGQAADYRKSASELQKKQEAYEEEKSRAETERLKAEGKWKEAAEKSQKDFEEFKRTAEQRQISAEVKAAAIAAGIITEKAAKLIDLSEVKFDASGELVGVKEAIDALKKESPELFKVERDTSKDVKNTGSEKGDPPPGKKGDPKGAVLATKDDGSYVMSNSEYEKYVKERMKNL